MRRPTRPVLVAFVVGVVLVSLSFVYGQSLSRSAANERAERTRVQQIEACERGNIVRTEINIRGEVLREFLLTAAEAREATAAISTSPAQQHIEQEAAARWRELAADVTPVEVPVCEEIIDEVSQA